MSLTELFCNVDDFCKNFEPALKQHLLTFDLKQPPKTKLSMSEIMTIVIHFHQSGYRCFKHYYQRHVQGYLAPFFPNLVSYNRFIELMPSALVGICPYLKTRMGKPTGISYVDSTSLAVCTNQRISRHKVFKGSAARGKTSIGWFFGFKLHLVVNDKGDLLSVQCTPGNVHDVKVLDDLCAHLFGKLFGDRGYISAEKAKNLKEKFGVELITTQRKNMKKKEIASFDKILLRGRTIIETINDQLKNIFQIEHSRHRSWGNFAVNLISALIAYTYQEKKPSLNIERSELVSANF